MLGVGKADLDPINQGERIGPEFRDLPGVLLGPLASLQGVPTIAHLKVDGRMVYLWRAVDAEGEVLDVLVQSKRNKHIALKLMRKLLKKYAFVPERLVR